MRRWARIRQITIRWDDARYSPRNTTSYPTDVQIPAQLRRLVDVARTEDVVRAVFSFTIAPQPRRRRRDHEHPGGAVHTGALPGAVLDPDTGQLISDAQVAEVQDTAFADSRHRITGRP